MLHNLAWLKFTTSESFQMRYCMTLYLKGYQKYNRSKLKSLDLLYKSWSFNFDLTYFWYPLRYKVIPYLVEKLSDMVKKAQEGLLVSAFLSSDMDVLNNANLQHKWGLIDSQMVNTVCPIVYLSFTNSLKCLTF